MTDKYRLVNWSHFDNGLRYKVFSDGDGHYQVRDTKSDGFCIVQMIAADYAAMKAMELNRA